MKLLILLSLILAAIVVFNYYLIKRINSMRELSLKQKNYWVFVIIYFPVFGGLFFLYKLNSNSL